MAKIETTATTLVFLYQIDTQFDTKSVTVFDFA